MNLSDVFALAMRRTASLPVRVSPPPSQLAAGPVDVYRPGGYDPADAAALLLMLSDAALRQQWVTWCTHAGYVVWHTGQASEGLRAISDLSIDVVVVDAALPNMGGCSIAEYIRAMHPRTRVIVTARDAIADADDARMAKLDTPVVIDPTNRTTLIETIRDELRLVK